MRGTQPLAVTAVCTAPNPSGGRCTTDWWGITGKLLVHVTRKVNYVIQVAKVDDGRGLAGPGTAGNDDDGGDSGNGGGAQHAAAADHHPARHIPKSQFGWDGTDTRSRWWTAW